MSLEVTDRGEYQVAVEDLERAKEIGIRLVKRRRQGKYTVIAFQHIAVLHGARYVGLHSAAF